MTPNIPPVVPPPPITSPPVAPPPVIGLPTPPPVLPFYQQASFLVMSFIFCFPVGILLVLASPTAKLSAKIAAGAFGCFMLICILSATKQKPVQVSATQSAATHAALVPPAKGAALKPKTAVVVHAKDITHKNIEHDATRDANPPVTRLSPATRLEIFHEMHRSQNAVADDVAKRYEGLDDPVSVNEQDKEINHETDKAFALLKAKWQVTDKELDRIAFEGVDKDWSWLY